MAADRYKNFRIRGIPYEYDTRTSVRDLVKKTLNLEPGASVMVNSVAIHPLHPQTRTATLTFCTIPDCFADCPQKEWIFKLLGNDLDFERVLVFDSHFSGFTPLHRTIDDDCEVDVIAISGLGGHALGSFKERGGPFMWLRDALPLDIPNARILIYGYDTQLIRSNSFQNLTDLGRALQHNLKGIRIKNSSRPILFVAHSLGGLVVKEAIVKFKAGTSETDASILNSTSGFVFFGVPHQGLAIESLYPLVKNQPNRGLLESLNKNSALLERLEHEFRHAFGVNRPKIVSFYETKTSPTAVEVCDGRWEMTGPQEVLVDIPSATCGSQQQHRHPIERNHSEMVKYSHPFDDPYSQVRDILKSMCNIVESMQGVDMRVGSNPYKTLSEQNIECLRSLSFREQEYRYSDVHTAKNTCLWLLEDPQYRAWINRLQGLFWIKGNPGSGKSVLMKFAVDTLNQEHSGAIVASFFIHGRGISLQKSPLGIFRALLNTILNSFPEYLSLLTERFMDREARFGSYQDGRWGWVEKELQDFLSEVLTKGTTKRPTVIFLDALDECGEECAKSLLTYFKNLMSDIEREKGLVKICFSSRHYPILGPQTVWTPTISVEERNDKDIRFVVGNQLKDIQPTEKRQQIENEILLKAHGGFQWAIIITSQILDGYSTGTKADTLYKKLTVIPEALDELYAAILINVSFEERQQMAKLFQWVLLAERPLSAQELRDALATDRNMNITTVSELRGHDDWIESLSEFETWIRYISRGLVEFQTRDVWEQYDDDGEDDDREAQFIHQSVADYILENFFNSIEDGLSSQSVVGAAHYEISRSCLGYLCLKELLEATHLSRGKLSARFHLLPYIICYLFHHIHEVERQGINQTDLLSLFQLNWHSKVQEKIALVWTVMDPDKAHAPLGWPFIGATPLHISVGFGAMSCVLALLEKNDADLGSIDRDGNTPLHLALIERHEEIASKLLAHMTEVQHARQRNDQLSTPGFSIMQGENHFSHINLMNYEDETPLNVAVAMKATDMIFKLIEAGANLKDAGHETELMIYALDNRNESLLLKLLEKGVTLDGAVYYAVTKIADGDGDDVLVEVVEKLLKAGANWNKSPNFHHRPPVDSDDDDEGDSSDESQYNEAVCIAFQIGITAILKLFLAHSKEATMAVLEDKMARNLLLLEVEQDDTNIEVMKLLLEYNAPVALQDELGFHPLLGAVMEDYPDIEVIKLLLENNAPVALQDNIGTHPLLESVTRDDPDIEVIKLLLEYNAPLALQDNTGIHPLLGAVMQYDPDIEVIKLLLEYNAPVSFQDNAGTHPLLHSVARVDPDIEVIKLLLEYNAPLALQDNTGMNPLLVAAEQDYPDIEVIKLLLENNAPVVLQDNYGTHPLLASIQKHQDIEVIKLLLEYNAPVALQDNTGMHPLLDAVQEGQSIEVIKLLLEYNAPVALQDNTGMHPLLAAVQKHQDIEVIKLLLEYNAPVALQDNTGMHPLLAAVHISQSIEVKKLLYDTPVALQDNSIRHQFLVAIQDN